MTDTNVDIEMEVVADIMRRLNERNLDIKWLADELVMSYEYTEQVMTGKKPLKLAIAVLMLIALNSSLDECVATISDTESHHLH